MQVLIIGVHDFVTHLAGYDDVQIEILIGEIVSHAKGIPGCGPSQESLIADIDSVIMVDIAHTGCTDSRGCLLRIFEVVGLCLVQSFEYVAVQFSDTAALGCAVVIVVATCTSDGCMVQQGDDLVIVEGNVEIRAPGKVADEITAADGELM